jgi:CRISPR-associated endonuclease Cas2
MAKFILIFDIPRERRYLRVKVNRALHKLGATKLQHSVWEADRLSHLAPIAGEIRREGGRAIIIEKRQIF